MLTKKNNVKFEGELNMKNSWIFYIYLFIFKKKIFLCLNFDILCPSFHQYRRRSDFSQPCLYFNFDVNHGGVFFSVVTLYFGFLV
jgi:hypothetical protein